MSGRTLAAAALLLCLAGGAWAEPRGDWAEIRPTKRPADAGAPVPGTTPAPPARPSVRPAPETAPPPPRRPALGAAHRRSAARRPAPARLAAAPIHRRIGGLLLLGFEGTEPGDPGVERIAAALEDGLAGGVLLLGRNVRSKAQLRRLIGHLRGRAGTPPPLVAVDQEGGRVQRFGPAAGFAAVPSAARLGAGAPEAASARYAAMARELAEVGVNLNLGPVVDLALDPENPVIVGLGRSYGADPERVGRFAAAFVDAHRAEGIATAAKHFPGHGSSRRDTHLAPADVTETWRAEELAPYRALAAARRLDAVMVAHVSHERLTGARDRPASLAAPAVAGRLRGLLGEGVVAITDDLDMAAVRARWSVEEAAIAAIAAGNDLLIVSDSARPDPLRAERLVAALAEAVAEGRIPPDRIAEAAARLAALRARVR